MKSRLYQFVASPFCAKVRKILDYKGLDYEIVEIDYLERKELLAASGQIMVPVLTLPDGETIVDSGRIASRLEDLYPTPTIFPPGWRGVHEALAAYFENEVQDAVFVVALTDICAHFARQGRDRLAFYRFVRERKSGVGFCDRVEREQAAHRDHLRAVLAPLDQSLADRPFLMGRIGLADFTLYAQLFMLALTGEVKIPVELANLRAWFDRVDRISARLES